MESKTWTVQDARQKFSELVRAAEAGVPQIISRHGRPVAVLVDMATHGGPQRRGFKQFLLEGPVADDLELPERRIEERVIEW